MLKSLKAFNVKDKRILLRVDFNVPMNGGLVLDDFRIRAAVPTIQHCLRQGASIVLMTHLGRPDGKENSELSLMPVGEILADLLEMPIKFSANCISEDARNVTIGLKPGEIHLLENLRFHKEEQQNDPRFSALLAKHGQIFINDAFGTSHRAHASNVGVTDSFMNKGIGLLMEKEIQILSNLINRPKKPLVVVLGGAKISSKIGLIRQFIESADFILIGGGMAFTFLKVMGKDVGKSMVDDKRLITAKKILSLAREKAVLEFPKDIVCAPDPDSPDDSEVFKAGKIPENMAGLDIGPETVKHYCNIIKTAGTVFWNGPMGVFEKPGFENGTRAVSEALSEATETGTITVTGGGDSASALKKFNLVSGISHISTGGGAALELLSGLPLPALTALER
ncbi:MAG: phosphoglycerate kinase [Candidatus Neomarinimicrobiota bacterium]